MRVSVRSIYGHAYYARVERHARFREIYVWSHTDSTETRMERVLARNKRAE